MGLAFGGAAVMPHKVGGVVGENLPQPGQPFSLGGAPELVKIAVGFQHRLLNQIGGVDLARSQLSTWARATMPRKLRHWEKSRVKLTRVAAASAGQQVGDAQAVGGNGGHRVMAHSSRHTPCAVEP